MTFRMLLALALFAGLHQAVAQAIQNSDFETPYVGGDGYYSFQYNPTGAGWTFAGYAGIAANGSGFAAFNAGTPDGSQFAFLQGNQGVGGSMSQTLSLPSAADYTFTFIASQRDIVGRDNSQNQTVTVLVDGTNVGSFTPPDPNWYSYSTTPISLGAGSHVLSFTDLPVAGDATIRLDTITVSNTSIVYSTNYFVDWFKVAGGGGTSTNGDYSVTGTFGQPDAGGPMQGGGYSAEGGFWSLYGVQSSSVTGNAPVIASQPQSVFVSNGAPASFSVAVSGTPPLFYQWQKSAINLTDAGNVSGSTTANLALSTISTNDAGDYTVIAENAYGSATSSVAKLTIILPTTAIISTTNSWDGANYIYDFGFPNTGTYGQTFVSPSQSPILTGFTVYIENISAYVNFRFYVMAWNGSEATGPILYQGPETTTAGLSGFQAYTFNTGNLALTPGTAYVAFGSITPDFSGLAGWGSPSSHPYADGHFVYDNNGTNFSLLTNSTWSAFPASDLAFVADFGIINFPPRFATVTGTGGDVTFSWNTVNTFPPVGYQVQYTTNLSASNWLNLGTVLTGAGPTISATDTNTTDAERFYRVMLVQ